MSRNGENGRDTEDDYCHTCGGYHTDEDRMYCPDRRWQEAYRQGYASGFHAGVSHYVGHHLRRNEPNAA